MTTDSLSTAAAGLPYAFLEAVADHGETALHKWLKEHAPKDVFELFDCLMAVKVETTGMLRGPRTWRVDSSLLEYVATIARVSSALGATWHDNDGCEILWRGAAEQPAADEPTPELQAEPA